MATRAVASLIIPVNIDKVWSEVRNFTFPKKMISTIESCEMLENASPNTVGASRKIKWKTGEERVDRLIELSDQYRRITWELVHSEPATEATAAISSIRLIRVTETNHTFVEWSCDFSADVSADFVLFSQKAFMENLVEMRKALSA